MKDKWVLRRKRAGRYFAEGRNAASEGASEGVAREVGGKHSKGILGKLNEERHAVNSKCRGNQVLLPASTDMGMYNTK